MKKRVTVIIALLACLVLAVCLFAACNDGGSTTNRGAFFTVTFDTQGGSAVDPVQVRRGGVLEQPEDPDRPGYIFAGWYLGDGKYDFGSRVSQDITLTAHWQARKITVRFVADAIAVKEIEVDYGGSIAPEDIPAVPEKEGYTGVWDTVDLSGITSSVTVNAVYTFIEREVTFVLNYSGAEDVTVMTENGLIDFVPEREGYVFNGWWYSGGHTDGGYILIRRHDMADVITEDGVTLYAEWVEEKEYASQLSAPSVSIDGSRFYWDAVEGARNYTVIIRGESLTNDYVTYTNSTSYHFPDFDAGYYTVSVCANGNGSTSYNSAFTSKQYPHKRLTSPTRIEMNATTSVLTWNPVMNATEYDIYVSNEHVDTVKSPLYDMSAYDAGTYSMRIIAVRDGWTSASSSASIKKVRLKAPEVTVADTYDGYLLTWNAVVNADTYIVTIGEEEFRTGELSFTVSCGDDDLWQDANALTVTVAAFDSGTEYLISLDAAENELIRKYSLTLSSDAGDVSGEGWYKAGERVNINAEIPTYAASSWLGWYKDGEKVSDTRTYTFAMPSESVTLTARWIKVIAQSEDTDKGTVTPLTGTYFPGNVVTVTATTNLGYTFIGWYKGGEKVSDTLTHTFKMPAENATYTARWELNEDMQPFIFSSGPSSLTITGVRDASVTEIMIPEYVTHIGGSAFSGCSSLESITIPFVGATKDGTGSTHFGYIFGASSYSNNDDCVPTSLKEVTITGGASIGSYAFAYCIGLTFVTIPDSVTSIGDAAFYGCTGLTSVTIGNGVTSIGSSAFLGCTGLTEINWNADAVNNFSPNNNVFYNAGTSGNGIAVTFGDSVTSIPAYLFDVYNSSCSPKVTSVTIGNNVTRIGIGAFYDCTGLTEIYYTGDVAGWCEVSGLDEVMSSGRTLYIGGEKVEGALVIPDGVTSIGERAFYGCSGLTSVAIPDSVTSIGIYAFYGCTGLTSVTIGNGVTSIGNWAFEDCSGLTSVTIPDSVTYIGYYAFEGCTGLTSVTIGNGVTSIGDDAFYGCSSLTSIVVEEGNFVYHSAGNCLIKTASKTLIAGCKTSVIPNDGSVTSIGSSAFSGCVGLTSIIIPDSVTSIEGSAFRGCTGLTSVTIGNGVSSIGNSAFSDCTGLTSITIPDNVTNIGYYAFEGCSSLECITIPFVGATKDGTSNTHFGYIFGASSYSNNDDYVPTSLKEVIITGGASIGDRTFYGCTSLTSITIPDSVTSIGYGAFRGCSGLTSITIPDSVTSIGSYAFSGCSSLESITIPFVGDSAGKTSSSTYQYPFGYIFGTSSYTGGTGVEQTYRGSSKSSTTSTTYYIPSSLRSVTVTGGNILYGAFYNCSMLTSITIPDGVTSIGERAFYGCTGLTEIYCTGDVASWCGISGLDEVMSSGRTLYIGGEKVEGAITVPDGVLFVPSYAFAYQTGITSVTIPDSVMSIGGAAFSGCSSLTSITIPDSVTSIGSGTFSGCSSLESISIPFVGAAAGKTSSSTYQYPFGYIFGTSSYTGGTAVCQYYYGYSTSRTTYDTYYIPSSLRSVTVTGGNILYGAFYNCSMLTSITIPDSVTSIGSSAFYGCSGLTSITIPDSVTSIRESAFEGCISLTSITIPDSVTSIGSSAFDGCTGLTSITIPDSVTSIGDYAFSGCTGLTEINWDADAVNNFSYNSSVFYNAGTSGNGITVTFGDSVTSIPAYLFYVSNSAYSPKVTSVIIGNNVTSIGNYAFSGCTGLMSINIPDSVTSIGYAAFWGCTDLTSITIPDSVTSIGDSAFRGCTGLTSITIPDSVTSIRDYAFSCCTGLTSITIPDSVTSIGYYAFSGCSSLECITIPFVGATKDGTSNTHFGYIFGASSYSNNDDYVPTSLKEVIITGGASIGNWAFYNCDGLTSIIIPDSVKSIGYSAFNDCSGLTSVTIGNSVTSIGESAFYSCNSLVSIHYTGDMASWLGKNWHSRVMSSGRTLYLDGEKVEGAITVPDGVDSIPSYAFAYQAGITSVIISGSVTSIGEDAFEDCSGLTSVTIPDSVTSIRDYAFSGCTGLTSITIPDSVTSIGGYAFSGCSSLETIEVDIDNLAYASVDGILYNKAQTEFIHIPAALAGDVTIPDSVTSIGYAAFRNCTGLTSITIPDSVTSIGADAFWGCTDLTSVTIPDSVTSIGDSAFRGCTGLTSITIPDSVTSIGADAFYGCGGLTSIVVEEGNSVYHSAGNCLIKTAGKTLIAGCKTSVIPNDGSVTSIGSSAFRSCSGLTSITIPDSVTGIGSYAFYDCDGLTSVTIGNGVTSIGGYAFSGCTSLTSVTIPDSVTSIGWAAFLGCTGLTEINWDADAVNNFSYNSSVFYNAGTSGNGITVTFGDSVTSIPAYLFYVSNSAYSPKVTSVIIGNNVTSIGSSAFRGCTGLTSITIPDSVTSIGSSAFYGCSGLTSITIPDSVTSIGNYAFSDCSSLTSITIPDSVTSIGESAFSGCDGLTSITIPDSVTSIGDRAFYGCTSLTSITIPDSVTSIGDYTFWGCTGLTEINWNATAVNYFSSNSSVFHNAGTSGNGIAVTFGDSVTSIPAYLFYVSNSAYSPKVTSVIIGDNVTSIGERAFYGCSGLTSVTIPDSVTSIGNYAFRSCTGLTSITIPDSVTSIGSSAFSGCTGLTSVTIGNSVTSIGDCAFYGCTGLTSITIPDSVTSIGDDAFYGCTGLTSVTFEETTGWYRTSSSWATSGTSLSSISLADSSTAAKWLRNTYSNYYWKRNV